MDHNVSVDGRLLRVHTVSRKNRYAPVFFASVSPDHASSGVCDAMTIDFL